MKKNSIITHSLIYYQKVLPLKRLQIYNSEITVVVKSNLIKDILFFFKNSMLCQFNVITSISGADFPKNKLRFHIVYDLLSLKYNSRIKIKILTNELSPVFSCFKIFSAANWFESEIWDMYGVFFIDHPNLKRLLTDYGFEGHPLRKDFPLNGFIEMRFMEKIKRVSSESIELNQEFRTFNFVSPWQNLKIKFMIKIIQRDYKSRISICALETDKKLLKSITQNFNFFNTTRWNVSIKLYNFLSVSSKTRLVFKCILKSSKKRINRLYKYSRQIFLGLVRFGAISGLRKSSW